MLDWHLVLLGLGIGGLIGLTGIGSGVLLAPILIAYFHYSSRVAIGTDLAFAAVVKSIGAWQRYTMGDVDILIVKRLCCGSVPASIAGVWLSYKIGNQIGHKTEHVFHLVLGAILILTALLILSQLFKTTKFALQRLSLSFSSHPIRDAIILGIVVGFVVGLTSIGSGIFFGVIMVVGLGLGTRKVVATELYHSAIISLVAALGHLIIGTVSWLLLISLLAGALPGVIMGSRLTVRLSENILQPALAALLLLSAIKLL